jgi:hypothetical protein
VWVDTTLLFYLELSHIADIEFGDQCARIETPCRGEGLLEVVSGNDDRGNEIRDLNLRRQTQLSLQDIARQLNPLLRGWIGYYGRYARSALAPLLGYVNQTLVAWARRKFKRFNRSKILASQFLQRLAKARADLFAHWRIALTGVFA